MIKKSMYMILIAVLLIILICSTLMGVFSKVKVGTINYKDGHLYEGEIKKIFFVIRLPHGQGVYKYEDPILNLQCMVEDDQNINKETILKYEDVFNKGEYEGEWKNGYKHGWGKALIVASGTYEGEWYYSMRQGWGVYNELYYDIYDNYEYLLRDYYMHYEGHWKNDTPDGLGAALYFDGSKYIGEWKSGGRHAQGTMFYPDGSKYTGRWENDGKHGYGVIIYPDGTTEKGIWHKGENLMSRDLSP